MYQINLLEQNNIYVSCGDPERDSLILLSRKKDHALIRELADMMHRNISLCFSWYYDDADINYECGYADEAKIQFGRGWNKYTKKIGYFDKNCNLWVSELTASRNRNDETNKNPKVSLSEFKKSERFFLDLFFINSTEELEKKLKDKYPYAYSLYESRFSENIDNRHNAITSFLMAPQLEQLIKAGYAFATYVVERTYWLDDQDVECFNRLCKRGSSIKEIFKTPKTVYETLKDNIQLKYWDVIRKMFKNNTITQDTIAQIVDAGYMKQDLEKISYILRQKYKDKTLFTFDSLMNYLRRLDMYEAIGVREAYMLLKDYLHMCNLLEVEPKLDGDSLKREHDITARTLRNKRDEIRSKKLDASCGYLANYNFEDDKYLIRGIRSYQDLLDEAKQQHNCVACYADRISSRQSLIYVLRRKADPDKSFVTVELSPNLKDIRQRFLAYNQPVRDKEVTDFLDKWLEFINNKEEVI